MQNKLIISILILGLLLLAGCRQEQTIAPSNTEKYNIRCPDSVIEIEGTYNKTCSCTSDEYNKSIFFDLGCTQENNHCNFVTEQKEKLFKISNHWFCICNVTLPNVYCYGLVGYESQGWYVNGTRQETKEVILNY